MTIYDTTTGGLDNAGLTDGPGRSHAEVERTRDALDDVRTPAAAAPDRTARVPVAAGAGALLLAGSAAVAVLLRRRAAAKKKTGWKRLLRR